MTVRVLLAGGGTAGHIEPALAVADALSKKDPAPECIFVGTEGGLENLLVPKSGYELRTIPKVTLPRGFSISALTFPIRILRSIMAAHRALRGIDIVIGFGGYVSASTYIAARLSGVPIVIHEANAKPGWANRIARSWAEVVAVTFDEVRESWPGSVLTGIPLRESVLSLYSMSPQSREEFRSLNCQSWGFDPAKRVIAIFGGSQGSRHINQVVADYLASNEVPSNLQILHAVGVNNALPASRPNYLPMPYFHDMAAIYGSADVLLTRSGAVTCAEIATVGSYAILVPLPHGNGEQVNNADSLVRQGRAIAISDNNFTAAWLREKLQSALGAADSLGRMPSAIHIGAAQRIADLALAAL